MSYTPNTWESGDVVTSAKLNNIETGISNATPLILLFSDDTGACNHTWQEIYDALSVGRIVVSPYSEGRTNVQADLIVAAIAINNGFDIYGVGGVAAATPFATADSADGYPVLP